MGTVLIVDPVVPDEALLRRAAALLAAGEVVAFPTDTLYGLAVDPRNQEAVARLRQAKGRSDDKALPLVACDARQVEEQVGRMSPVARRLAARFWPGPLALVIDGWPDLAPGVAAADGGVAVRVPAHDVARQLARLAGHPLTATSANRSGEPPPRTAQETAEAVGGAVAAVLDAGPTPGGPPSTIVDVRGARAALVRAGAVPWAHVLEFLES